MEKLKLNLKFDAKPAAHLTADRSAALSLHTALKDGLDLLGKIERGETIRAQDYRATVTEMRRALNTGAQLLFNVRFNK